MYINSNIDFDMNEIIKNKRFNNRNKFHSANFNDISPNNNVSYFGNLKKQNHINDEITKRYNNCNEAPPPLLPPRPSFNKCEGSSRVNRNNKTLNKMSNIELPSCCEKNECIGDKGNPLKYFSSVDVESYILNIDRKLNNCRSIEYKRDISCSNCDKLCCHKIEHNIDLPKQHYNNPNNCITLKKPKKCNKIINSPRNFDTLYEYKNSNCSHCEPVWYQHSKRRYLDPINCDKSKFYIPNKECPKPCLGNQPDINNLLKDTRNKQFKFCTKLFDSSNKLVFNK